jgi:two-component system, NarL family, invasion response regulator UvrY
MLTNCEQNKIRIFICGDHAIVREGLKRIVTATQDMEVSGEAPSGTELLQKVRDGKWDVVLLDLSLPDLNGLDALKQIHLKRPRLPVLVLSMYSEDEYAFRALKAGAAGYLTKGTAPGQLIGAIRTVTSGRHYVSEALAERLAGFAFGPASECPRHLALSDREYQVLLFLASGMPIKAIANELELSAKTVSTYRTRILEKLEMKSNADMIRYCIENSLHQT